MNGIVEIESQRTARRAGTNECRVRGQAHPPAKGAGRVGQPREESWLTKGWASPRLPVPETGGHTS